MSEEIKVVDIQIEDEAYLKVFKSLNHVLGEEYCFVVRNYDSQGELDTTRFNLSKDQVEELIRLLSIDIQEEKYFYESVMRKYIRES